MPVLEYGHIDNLVLISYTLNLNDEMVLLEVHGCALYPAGFCLLQRLLRPLDGSADRKFPEDN